jgi:hypothetical protein
MKKNCKYYEFCNAPLCPLDEESLEEGIWYPDEEICKKRTSLKWIKNQKKIVKLGTPVDFYFDYQMLNSLKKIRRGIKGKDPDAFVREEIKKDERLEKVWEIEK